MSIAGSHKSSCRDYKPCSRQSPGSARRGRDVNPASSTAIAQCRKAQTYNPVRDKLRSQPGREDHQAYRYSKGSVATESEEDRANATLCLSLEASGSGCRDYKSGMRQIPGRARRGREVNPASRHREDHQAYRNSKGSEPPYRGRQGQRHTMSIAVVIRTLLS